MNIEKPEDFKADPKAEAHIKTIMSIWPDLEEDAARFIFNLGATYGANSISEKAKEMMAASWKARLKRAGLGGEA